MKMNPTTVITGAAHKKIRTKAMRVPLLRATDLFRELAEEKGARAGRVVASVAGKTDGWAGRGTSSISQRTMPAEFKSTNRLHSHKSLKTLGPGRGGRHERGRGGATTPSAISARTAHTPNSPVGLSLLLSRPRIYPTCHKLLQQLRSLREVDHGHSSFLPRRTRIRRGN